MKFIHRFSRPLSVEMTVADEPPQKGEAYILGIEWTGSPKPKHTAEYRQWILHTNSLLAERWGKSILYGLGVSPNCTELWQFELSRAPKLIKKVPFGIP